MSNRNHGLRSKTRHKFKRWGDSKPGITKLLKDFAEGEKVSIVVESSVQRGMPHSRFHGLTGVVVKKRGRAYVIDLRVGNKMKKVISLPVHLRRAG